jgi:hypothetical protein
MADTITELDDGTIYMKLLYLMVKTMVSCRFPLNQSIDTNIDNVLAKGFIPKCVEKSF